MKSRLGSHELCGAGGIRLEDAETSVGFQHHGSCFRGAGEAGCSGGSFDLLLGDPLRPHCAPEESTLMGEQHRLGLDEALQTSGVCHGPGEDVLQTHEDHECRDALGETDRGRQEDRGERRSEGDGHHEVERIELRECSLARYPEDRDECHIRAAGDCEAAGYPTDPDPKPVVSSRQLFRALSATRSVSSSACS